MTLQKKSALAGGTPTRGATDKAAGLMSTPSIHQNAPQNKPFLALGEVLAHLAALRDRFWACDRNDPQLDDLARQYRAAYRKARQFSPDASRLIDQALERERYHLDQAQRARAIRRELEARFVPSLGSDQAGEVDDPKERRFAKLEHDLVIDRAERGDLRARLDALGTPGATGKEART